MKPQRTDVSCFYALGLALITLVVIVGKAVVDFFKRPDALRQIFYNLLGLGVCLGVAVAFVALLVVFSRISNSISRKRRLRVIYEGAPYPVRCYPVLMEKWVNGPLPQKLAEQPGQESKWPFEFNLAMTNHGPCILPPAVPPVPEKTNPQVAFPLSLFSPNWAEPVFIALGSANLYYLPYHSQGNFKIEQMPADSFGYHHKVPSVPARHELELILLCQCLVPKANLEQFERLEHPLQLKMMVLDGNGQYDLRATAALYRSLYDRIEALQTSDDDESWMYRSRPILW